MSWVHIRSASKALLMSTHNICFLRGKIKKISIGLVSLSTDSIGRGWLGGAKVSCILRHLGVQLIIGLQLGKACYSCSR